MHLLIPFGLDFFSISILTLVPLIQGQVVWPNAQNANRWSGFNSRMGFTTGYQPSGSETRNLGEGLRNLNYKDKSYGSQFENDFRYPFKKPAGLDSSFKFLNEPPSFISPIGTNSFRSGIEKSADLSYVFPDSIDIFGPQVYNKNRFNFQQGNFANSDLRKMPINNQNNGFNNAFLSNVDRRTFPNGGTPPITNRNVAFNGWPFNNGAMKTSTIGNMPEQNARFNNGPLINAEAKKFSNWPPASTVYAGNGNFPTATSGGVFPRNDMNYQKFAPGIPLNPAVISPENFLNGETTTTSSVTVLNTPTEKSEESSDSKDPKIASDVQDGLDIINRTDVENVATTSMDDMDDSSTTTTAMPETSTLPVEKDLPTFLASAVNKFNTPSTVHYISSAVSLLMTDGKFDIVSLPSVIMALTMQIRSAFPGLSNDELLNQVFLQLIIALSHLLKQSKVGDVNYDGIAETAETVMKAF